MTDMILISLSLLSFICGYIMGTRKPVKVKYIPQFPDTIEKRKGYEVPIQNRYRAYVPHLDPLKQMSGLEESAYD